VPKQPWDPTGVPDRWKEHYFLRIRDLVDRHEPDLLYTDGPIFFDEWGLSLIAHLYNRSARKHGGKVEAVYNNKGKADCKQGTCVLDLERGVVDRIWDQPWQTDTCVGKWHYDAEAQYKSPKLIVDMLVDIVSRNGNMLLNFPLPSSGALDAAELKILDEITRWMAVNGEAIYGTRPWKIFGEGPPAPKPEPGKQAASGFVEQATFNEQQRKDLTAADIRFTRKGRTLYAFSMGWAETEVRIPSLGLGGAASAGKIQKVELLGHPAPLKWRQDATAVAIAVPERRPSDHAVAFRIRATEL
jgi:alpha-L-fucosidase